MNVLIEYGNTYVVDIVARTVTLLGAGVRITAGKRVAKVLALADAKVAREKGPMYSYQVEYQDDDDKTHVKPYGNRLAAAQTAARRASNKHMVAYVVANRQLPDGGEAAVGHKSYGQGLLMETEGEGFRV